MIAGLASDSPWAPMLGLLPPELGRSLGPSLDKLAAAVGPLRARARTGTGAPDGFEGLSLRGPYDRLVLSEWALADLLPEEFVRRAAQGEHAFYQLARRDEARAKTSVALFDPGPMQLGGPRIGQLLALLVLAGRARAAGASFGWATLQRPPPQSDTATGLWLGLTAVDLRSFLLGRTAFAPAPADLDGWFERARRDDWEDLWVIGPPGTIPPGRRLAGVKTPVGRIELSDVFEPGVRALDVTVVRGAHRRTLRVELPPEAECLQLLRGGVPLPPKPVTPVGLARTPGVARPVSPPILLADGRKVAFVDAGNAVTVYTVPDVPSPRRARYLRYAVTSGDRVLGLGWARRRLVLVFERAGELHVSDTYGDVFRAGDSLRRFDAPGTWHPGARPAALARVDLLAPSAAPGTPSMAFLDGARRLIALLPARAAVLAEHACGAAYFNERLRAVVHPHLDPALASLRAFLHPSHVVAAVVDSGPDTKLALRWTCFPKQGGATVPPVGAGAAVMHLPGGDEVLGLTPAPKLDAGVGLIALAPDRCTLRWISPEHSGVLFSVGRPVRDASTTPRGDRVALAFEDGALEVWSLPAPVCLLRVEPPP